MLQQKKKNCQCVRFCTTKFYVFPNFMKKRERRINVPETFSVLLKKMQKHFGNFSRRMCRTKRVKLQYEQELFAGTKRIQEIDWSYLCMHLG